MKDEPKGFIVFELNRCAMVQKIIFFADPEAKNADASLKPDNIELNNINT